MTHSSGFATCPLDPSSIQYKLTPPYFSYLVRGEGVQSVNNFLFRPSSDSHFNSSTPPLEQVIDARHGPIIQD